VGSVSSSALLNGEVSELLKVPNASFLSQQEVSWNDWQSDHPNASLHEWVAGY
jgi:hypothetical protein